MALAANEPLISGSTNSCCDEWKKKYLKLQESRNALRQAVKVLESKINEIQAHNVNLKKACEEERARARIEKEEKLKESNARLSLENEVCSLKSEIDAIKQKCGSDAQNENENSKALQACICDREKEINRLKELLEREKRRADSERKNAEKEKKKAAEASKSLEAEKNKKVEQGMQIAKIEAEKAEYRTQLGLLEKEVREVKAKLTSEMSMFKESAKRFEAETQRLLTEKQNAESGMKKARERTEIEKQKTTREKRRADAEMVKVEEQKKLAEDNWKKAMEEKNIVDQMSQHLEEDKQTIEDLKQKILEFSSLGKPFQMFGISPRISADKESRQSTEVKFLKNRLKLEKLRTKHIKQKFELEASRHGILQQELGRLKIDFIQLLQRLDMLDASFSPVNGSIHDQTKSENVPFIQNSSFMRQACNLDLSQINSHFENNILEPCCTTMDACDPCRAKVQHTSLLAQSGGNCTTSITGIDSKLEPLIRGSNRIKLQSSAVNSSTASFSDGQLMGSQETGAFPVTASAELAQEIFNARPNMCNPSDRSVIDHCRKRKRIQDTLEHIANLSSDGKKLCLVEESNLSDLNGLMYRNVDKYFEGGRERLPNVNNAQPRNDRAHKKRKKSHREKLDIVPRIKRDEKKDTEETKTKVYKDANVCRCTSNPASSTLETTKACGDIIDASNNFDCTIRFDDVADGSYMKLLELENAADEECYRRAVNFPLSPSLPEIEVHKTFDMDYMKPFLEETVQEDLLTSRKDLFPSHGFDVIDVEINSNEQKFDVSRFPSISQNKPTQARNTEVEKLSHMQTSENSTAAFPLESGIGSLHNQLPNICVIVSNIEDNSTISRIFFATKNCIARCGLATQAGWAVRNILTVLKMEEDLSQKEKVSVLLSLMLFNFTMTTAVMFEKLRDGNLFRCLNSYADHILTVMSDAETRILFLENYCLHELLGLIADFLIKGKVIVNNLVPAERLSGCDLRTNDLQDGVKTLSSDAASSEQLVAGSIILASVCAAADHVGFICEISYDVLRFCKWDSLVVLTILHIFAYLGGEKFFNLGNFGLVVTVLKSLVIFLEDETLSIATASCLPSVNQLHTEFHPNVKCPFSEGAESVDMVACFLLEEIKNCLLQGVERVDLSSSRFISDNYNGAGHWCNMEAVQCAINKNCDGPSCVNKYVTSNTQQDVLLNISLCHLSDVLSLVELVANKMSWHWTSIKLVPQLLSVLESTVEENFAIAIIVLLGQLGRVGIDASGYEDQAVGNLRCNLFAYFCRCSSIKAGPSLQFAAATTTALSGLLPLDIGALFHSDSNLSAYPKSVSDNVEILRKWFFGLSKDKQNVLCGILRCTDVYK